MRKVDIIVSSYEWICSDCGHLNKEIEYKDTVKCSYCGKTYLTNLPEHALEELSDEAQKVAIESERESKNELGFNDLLTEEFKYELDEDYIRDYLKDSENEYLANGDVYIGT